MKEKIIKYLVDTYNPEAIITYGSYANGSANKHSDFDALIIAESSISHDETEICGVILDVFIYSRKTFDEQYNAEDYLQIYDGTIEFDKFKTASQLMHTVQKYIDDIPLKTKEEIHQEIKWCEKMLLRTERDDAEGYFRWHWLLVDSLEIYFDIIKKKYFGPKKSLKYLANHDIDAYKKYETALRNFDYDSLLIWINHLSETFKK